MTAKKKQRSLTQFLSYQKKEIKKKKFRGPSTAP